jgi:tetratricopeptide (TPR) repeat protein
MHKLSAMATIADTYYIKALDYYPFNLEFAAEYLNYALAADKFHSGANHLMGLLCIEHIKDYNKAEFYLQRALSGDPENVNVCFSLAELFIRLREYDKADKLISYTKKLRGVDLSKLYTFEALKFEYMNEYDQALNKLYKASDEAYDFDSFEQLRFSIERVKEKMERNSLNIFNHV